MRRRLQLLLAGTVLLVGIAACDPSRWFEPNPHVSGDLWAARVRWAKHGFARYEFTMVVGGCECSFVSPVRITVSNGVIDGVYANGSTTAMPQSAWASYKSIEGLFSAAADAIDRHANMVSGQYDSAMGYPHELFIDLHGDLVDDEINYSILNVRAR